MALNNASFQSFHAEADRHFAEFIRDLESDALQSPVVRDSAFECDSEVATPLKSR